MPAAAVPEEDYEELRIGLVLNGGVSLAVWMGGVVTEIDRLRRADGPYGELLRLLATTARVDVIAGASAGGLNGGLLATAIAHGQPLDGLRDLWVSAGGFLKLFRSPFDRNPPSLMDGDGYFVEEIHKGLKQVAGPSRGAPAGSEPVHLTMVTSVLTGVTRGLADDFGAVIPDATHLGTFTFRRELGGRDDWDAPEALARIALAARSSASFPFAFEASFVPVGQEVGGRPDMKDHVNFPSSRFAVDGGALMNKPFRPALDAIYAQPASRQVRRALLYVAPDPGAVAADQVDDITKPPSLVTTLLDSAMTMPRTESVGAELKEIRAHNDAVANLRLVRDSLSQTDPTSLAAELFGPLYRVQRASRSVDRILARLDAEALPGPATVAASDRGRPTAVRDRDELRRDLLAARRAYLPPAFPAAGTDPAADPGSWLWGIDPVEAAANTVLDLLNRGLSLAPLTDTPRRGALCGARGAVHRHRQVVAAVRELDDGFWECESPFAAPGGWAAEAFGRWVTVVDALARLDGRIGAGVFEALTGRATAIARELVKAKPVLLEVAAAAGAAELAASVEALAPARTSVRPTKAAVAACLRRLLGLDVVLTSFSAALPSCDQFLQLMLLSGDTPNVFDRRETVGEKLNGVNAGHFAGFYKASWRANDWMFGRLDGAFRLAQVVLSPVRLLQLYRGQADLAFRHIEAVALGITPGFDEAPETRAVLAEPDGRQWDPARARAELDYLDDGRPPAPVLHECARGVARRLQLALLCEELPNVEEAVRTDLSEGAVESSGGAFQRSFPDHLRGQPLPARAAAGLFKKCLIGTEKMGGELGSDLMTSTVSAAAAVSVKAATGAGTGLGPLRPALALVRVAVMSFYVLARAAVARSRTGFAVLLILLTVSGLVLALPYVSADVDPPGPLTVAAAAVVLGSALLAGLRAGAPGRWLVMAVLTAAGFAAPLMLIRKEDREQADLKGLDSVVWAARPILAVAALIVVPWLCGEVLGRADRRRRRRAAARPA